VQVYNKLSVISWALVLLVPVGVAAQESDSSEYMYPDTSAIDPEDATIVRGFDVDIESLRGLQGVCIIIHDIDDFAEDDGLNESQVYFEVSLMLVKAGIGVVPQRFYEDSEGVAYLHVYVTILSTVVNYIYNLGIDLSHEVSLQRDPEIATTGITWRSQELGIVSMGEAETVIDSIILKVEEFIADHAAANVED
jgi:hypothetical protein